VDRATTVTSQQNNNNTELTSRTNKQNNNMSNHSDDEIHPWQEPIRTPPPTEVIEVEEGETTEEDEVGKRPADAPPEAVRLIGGPKSQHPGEAYWSVKKPGASGFKYFRWEKSKIQNKSEKEAAARREGPPPTRSSMVITDLDHLVQEMSKERVPSYAVRPTTAKWAGRKRKNGEQYPGQQEALKPNFSVSAPTNTTTTTTTTTKPTPARYISEDTYYLEQKRLRTTITNLEKLVRTLVENQDETAKAHYKKYLQDKKEAEIRQLLEDEEEEEERGRERTLKK